MDSDLRKKEPLPANPDLFFGRSSITDSPLVTFKTYYLSESDLAMENEVNFERDPLFELRI